MKKLQEIRDLVEEAIDNGARTVDQIHKSLAKRPFEMLNKIDLSGLPIDRLGDLRKLTIGDVSEFMGTMNQRVSEIAGELLRKVEGDKRTTPSDDSIPKRCSARTKSGSPCKNNPMAGSDYCHVHKGR